MTDRIAVDISGRHEMDGRYLMVCAAVHVSLNSDSVDEVNELVFEVTNTPKEPSFKVVVDTVKKTVENLDAGTVIVSEEGEFYNKPEWVVEGALGHGFKYIETIGERKAVETAHHAAYAARNLLLDTYNQYD